MRRASFPTALASASPGGEVGLACWAGGVTSRSPRAGAASLAWRLGRAQRTTGGAGGWGGGSQQASLPRTLRVQGSVTSPGAATSMAHRPWAASHHTVCQRIREILGKCGSSQGTSSPVSGMLSLLGCRRFLGQPLNELRSKSVSMEN